MELNGTFSDSKMVNFTLGQGANLGGFMAVSSDMMAEYRRRGLMKETELKR